MKSGLIKNKEFISLCQLICCGADTAGIVTIGLPKQKTNLNPFFLVGAVITEVLCLKQQTGYSKL